MVGRLHKKRDNLSVYFTQEFVSELESSKTWNEAFIKAKKRTEKLSVQMQARLGNYLRGFKGMHPQQSLKNTQLALPIMSKKSLGKAAEMANHGRFIDNGDGTVTDTKTGLMWAAKAGDQMTWVNANSYCKDYHSGGYDDWRLPTLNELAGLYDKNKFRRIQYCRGGYYLATDLIDIRCDGVWSSNTNESQAAFYLFYLGKVYWQPSKSIGSYPVALPVRSVKKAKKVEDVRKSDGRFIDNGDGTVMDTKTGLMWAANDNGSNIDWANAKSYCENYRGGGYTDWRMPTQYELAGLYDSAKTYKSDCGYYAHLTDLIHLSCTAQWASDTSGSDAACFFFDSGKRDWNPQSLEVRLNPRALPVRSIK